MTTYTAQLQITAQSAWETWYAASEVATEKTEAAIAWYCETFFSEKAMATYTTIGKVIGHLMVATVIVGMMARRRLQPWIDAQVEQALTPVSTEATEATDILKAVTQIATVVKTVMGLRSKASMAKKVYRAYSSHQLSSNSSPSMKRRQ